MIRMPWRPHPSYEMLSRHADQELPPAEAMRVNAHLARCSECRAEVDFMVDLRTRLRNLTGPTLPRTLLPEILSLRAMGERVILESEPEPEELAGDSGSAARAALPAAATLVLVGVSFALFGARGVEAGASALELEAASPGLRSAVEYRTVGPLAGQPVVRLRGEVYTQASDSWTTALPIPLTVDLDRRREGEFVGQLQLPPAAVYAHFALESLDGEVVDAGFEGWEFMGTRADGSPTFDALLQKSWDASDRDDSGAALAAARRLTELYGDSPKAWAWRLYVESTVPESMIPGFRDAHQRRLAEFEASLTDDASPDHLAAIADYALRLRTSETYERALQRLLAVAPNHPSSAQGRTLRAVREFGMAPARLLAALEEDWGIHGTIGNDGFTIALVAATTAGDEEGAVRWIDRWVAARPGVRFEATTWLERLPTVTDEMIDRARQAIRELDTELQRAVGQTAGQHRDELERRRSRLWRLSGELLLRAGEDEAAFDALLRAAAHSWDAESLDRLADLATERGDHRTAVRYRRLAAADPIAPPDLVERQRAALRALGAEIEDPTAERELRARLLDQHPPLHPRGPLPVETLTGLDRDLLSELGSRAAIVVFWSPYSDKTVQTGREVLAACADLASAGIRVLAVARDPIDETTLPELDLPPQCPSPWFFDRDRAAQSALYATRLGEIVVLDGTGALRYRGTSADDARRAALLLSESR